MKDSDAVMDDEFLAPVDYDPEATEADSEVEADDEEWEHAQGFPCTRRAVRIWVDEQTRHLTRVRLSTRWRERTAGRQLADSFTEAFFLANARVGSNLPSAPVPRPEPSSDLEFTWDNFQDLQERAAELMERSDELALRPPNEVRWADLTGTRATGLSSNGHVRVTLGLGGLTETVEFSSTWLQRARISEIADAVMSAHQSAYQRHVAPVFVPGEHEELAAELAQVQADMQAMMARGMA
ncbi:hypothetical protein FOJ82_00325 [Tessaracoccus rhinocerotis]|uniref:YbaB/EbfC family nucleoid-associated protein n=1 Tax=Tessaracoccus rhinocerotis TaxID=1689449 RepID=A0A553K3W4_9ACTN|nr:hypothetical protein [Tessaracoccus rhinocerotis]TRY19400.1 hypothetical protein FOJ82_00325 [Tessaracoccus rhinocerotis]